MPLISDDRADAREHEAAEAGSAFWPGRGLLIGLAVLAFTLPLAANFSDLPAFLLNRQDRWLLLIGSVLFSLACIRLRSREKPLSAGIWLPWAAAAGLLALCFAGHDWILSGYDLSRDEQMAVFDTAIFAQGHFVQSLPALWRDHASALNTLFMYPAEHRGAWVSAYLPFNALLRALIGAVGTPTLTGPLMTAIGGLALWGCARRIWPQDREAPVVALLLYAGSGQVILTGMTAYAMPAHLACNLVWLWLFLRRAWWADAAALVVGFVAVGLHQPLMHPMFAAPLLFPLLRDRQWPRAAFYAAGYAAIGLFWLWWPTWTSSLVQASLDARPPAGADFVTRFLATVGDRDPATLPEMIANLLRFLAWQHLLLLPLMLLGWTVARRGGLALGLAMGVIVTTLTMTLLLPYQAHGFGYRYLHGLIGNCILLAVYGWTSLKRRDAWRPLVVRASIAGGAVILPVQLWMAHAYYASAAEANARVAAIDADYAVIGDNDAPFSRDLVHNPPALDIRPVRLLGEHLDAALIAAICRDRPRVALVGDRMLVRINAYYGVEREGRAARKNHALAPRLEDAGCRVQILP